MGQTYAAYGAPAVKVTRAVSEEQLEAGRVMERPEMRT